MNQHFSQYIKIVNIIIKETTALTLHLYCSNIPIYVYKYGGAFMSSLTTLFKVLSDETRLRIIHLLNQHDLCVCEMVEILDLVQPKISKHISKIKTTDLITSIKNEQYIYYSLNKESKLFPLLNLILDESEDNRIFLEDMKKLKKIERFVCER